METVEAVLISVAITVGWLVIMVLMTKYLNKKDKDKDDKKK